MSMDSSLARLDIDERINLIGRFRDEFVRHRDEIIDASTHDIGFSYKDSLYEFTMHTERLAQFASARERMSRRQPVCDEDEEIVLLLPYNGSSWLNTAILSILLVGNNIRVKFSSRSGLIAKIMESVYAKSVGPAVRFDHRPGATIMTEALESRKVPMLVVFGSDSWLTPYEVAVRRASKKLVFEGPGNNPFIVMRDANLDAAVRELAETKYRNSGQACVAPQRIYVHEDKYERFLRAFVERTKRFVVGSPEDRDVDITPIMSAKVVKNLKFQLKDAVAKGGEVLTGGTIEGNLVHPTIIAKANPDMQGMRCEAFGPVSYVSSFGTAEQAVALARDSNYGLRASVWGGEDAKWVASVLKGAEYLEDVSAYTFGRFGTLSVNERLSDSWNGALVTKPIGGYGYSGWVWDFPRGRFQLRQGPKLFSLETSYEP